MDYTMRPFLISVLGDNSRIVLPLHKNQAPPLKNTRTGRQARERRAAGEQGMLGLSEGSGNESRKDATRPKSKGQDSEISHSVLRLHSALRASLSLRMLWSGGFRQQLPAT